jgi:hypothetical protein
LAVMKSWSEQEPVPVMGTLLVRSSVKFILPYNRLFTVNHQNKLISVIKKEFVIEFRHDFDPQSWSRNRQWLS